MTSTTSGAAPASERHEHRGDRDARRRRATRRATFGRATARGRRATSCCDEHDATSGRARPAGRRRSHAPDRPLAGSRSAALATVRRQAGTTSDRKKREQHEAQAAIDRLRGAASESRRTSAVTRGCWACRSAEMPPTHISQTSSSRAISSVQGIGWRRTWRPTTCRPTTAACATTSTAMDQLERAIGARCGRGDPCRAARSRADRLEPRRRRRARAPRVSHSRSAAGGNGAAVDLADRHAALASAARSRPRPRAGPSRAARRAASSARLLERARGCRPAAAPASTVDAHRPSTPAMWRVRAMKPRDLVEALLQRRARVVLVAVDDAGLQRRVDLAERHRRRAGAHQLDRLHVDRRLDRADLQAGAAAPAR